MVQVTMVHSVGVKLLKKPEKPFIDPVCGNCDSYGCLIEDAEGNEVDEDFCAHLWKTITWDMHSPVCDGSFSPSDSENLILKEKMIEYKKEMERYNKERKNKSKIDNYFYYFINTRLYIIHSRRSL